MPSPFGELQRQEIMTDSIDVTIPTPPPECAHDSPDSTHSCISPQLPASATSDSYIKGSSLEESPLSSPNSSCAGEIHTPGSRNGIISEIPKLIKRETCIHGTNEQTNRSQPNEKASSSNVLPHEQNVPKNIKLPQSKISLAYSLDESV